MDEVAADAAESARCWSGRSASIKLRRDHPVFRRRRYFQGRPIRGAGIKDIYWIQPDGTEMTDEAWSNDDNAIGVYIAGAASDLLDVRGDPVRDDNILLLLNSRDEDIEFTLPLQGRRRSGWRIEVDTARPRERRRAVRGSAYRLNGGRWRCSATRTSGSRAPRLPVGASTGTMDRSERP